MCGLPFMECHTGCCTGLRHPSLQRCSRPSPPHHSPFSAMCNHNELALKCLLVKFIVRAGLHYKPWSRTMEEGLFQWSNFLKKSILKALSPSLGVNRMWTKKNDHAPKSECADFILIYAQKGHFWKEKKKFAHSLVFSWALLVFTSC